jgi:hypothetical protein
MWLKVDPRALQAIRRGMKQPYFHKQSDNRAYSPHETKISILRGFSIRGMDEKANRSPYRAFFP